MKHSEIVDLIIRFEQGELLERDVITLFQHLVDIGLAWKLQGFYGRLAKDLIDAGHVLPPSKKGDKYYVS